MKVIKETRFHIIIADFNFNPPKDVKHNGNNYSFVEINSSGEAIYVSEYYGLFQIFCVLLILFLLWMLISHPFALFAMFAMVIPIIFFIIIAKWAIEKTGW
jgi:uncharacterized membrane protein